jgi:hypothetical protein
MEFITIITGLIALVVWMVVWLQAVRSPLGWISPAGLFAFGLLTFYIVPSLYWKCRPWNHSVPPYFEGLYLVLVGASVLGIPFLFVKSHFKKHRAVAFGNAGLSLRLFGAGLWLCNVPIVMGVGWKIYMVTLGYQSRLARINPQLFGSESLAYLFSNIGSYISAFYFALVLLGNKRQRHAGIIFWLFDGLIQMYTLQRYAMLLFVFRSAVFAAILGVRLKARHWLGMIFFAVFVIAIIGLTPNYASEEMSGGRSYITPTQAAYIVGKATWDFISAKASGGGESQLWKALDETMFRLFDARSAAAVMFNVPTVIPYRYGESVLQVFYAMIPRFVWEEKPSLRDIHMITDQVMPNDMGINPVGTIAELYLNGGFVAIFLGGIICFAICRWIGRLLLSQGAKRGIFLCVYPLTIEWIIGANFNFTQRLSEGIHLLIFFWLFEFFIRICRGRWLMKAPERAASATENTPPSIV